MPRGWRDRAFRPEEVSASGNSDREVLAAHDAEITNSHKAQKKTRKTGQPDAVTTGTSHHWTDSPLCAPGGGQPFRGERNPRMRKGQATGSVRIKRCRVVTSEAGGNSTRHTSPGVPVRRAVASGDRGALGGDVSYLWCSGRQHATCTFVPPCRRAGKPTPPTVRPRDFPVLEADVRPPPSGTRCAL